MNKHRNKIKQYIGNTYQIGGTRHYRLTDGNTDGCRCIDVKTGSGFDYTVVCDRGLDISLASYNTVYIHILCTIHSYNIDFAVIIIINSFNPRIPARNGENVEAGVCLSVIYD